MLDTEFENDYAIIKAKILYNISNSHDNRLIIGIDPGKRIGISILYKDQEIDSRVTTSISELINFIEMLINNVYKENVIIKIGFGDLNLALIIAEIINNKFNSIETELVNEYGTTSSIKDVRSRRRGIRDRLSARTIAYRRGISFKEYLSYIH